MQQLVGAFPHVTRKTHDWRCYTNAEYEAASIAFAGMFQL